MRLLFLIKMKQIYLISGDDAFSIEAFEKNFAKEKVDPEWETFNLNILDALDCSVDKIIESADSPPFGFGNKVTIVKNSESLFSQKEEFLIPLETLLAKNLMNTNFLLLSASSVDKRKNIVKNIIKFAEVKEFNQLKPWEIMKKLAPWIEDSFRKQGKRIEKEALDELMEAAGANKHRLEKEIEKLILYANENKIITVTDVRSLVVNTESDIFELLDHLARKEIGNSLKQINILLLREPPIKLISSLVTNFRTLYNMKLLADSNMSINDIAKGIGRPPFIVEKSVKAWRNIDLKKFRNILEDFFEIELMFKSRAVNAKLEIEKFIIKNFS